MSLNKKDSFKVIIISAIVIVSLCAGPSWADQSAMRPTKRIEFSEADGTPEGKLMFALDRPRDKERFKIRDDNPWVTVEPNGNVRVKRKWDYEELGPEKTIDFWVTITNTKSGDWDNQRVIVQVKDVNDEPPYFINWPLPMQAVVQLNAPPNTPVFTLQARDPDTDHNIHYFLVRDRTGGRFKVDERSGVVSTRGKKPFQLDTEYVIYVKAEDQNGSVDGSHYQSTPEERLSIFSGKRPPQWASYEIEIPEDQKKDKNIISMKAKSFTEREIRYTLKATGQGAGTFNIEPTTGNVRLVKDLDFEDLQQPHVYHLQVTATEESGFSTSFELTIRVTDVNDNVPKFELPDYTAHNIDEDIPISTSILKVKATDSDSGSNAEIEYSVSNDHFTIDSSGVISNAKQLDGENNHYYEFTVIARDKGESPKSGTANVRVYTKKNRIANKNDNPPYFDKTHYQVDVEEDEDIHHTVLTVKPKDLDDSSKVRYEITRGNLGGAFAIKNTTGAIYVAGPLDYETLKRYDLTLVASDSVNKSMARVVIYIRDQNDIPPVFNQTIYSANILEELTDPLPFKLLQVTATDGDKDREQNIFYFLSEGQGIDANNPTNSKFGINRTTGEIYVLKPLDRDQPNGRPQWRFTVFAQDEGGEGLVGYAEVQVNLKDINDNAPLFPHGVYLGNVTENGTAGMVVMTMTAVDYDDPNQGSNAKLTYSIEKNVIDENTGMPIFEIESETGVIKTAVPGLDREKAPNYSIQVVAMDGGGLKGTGTASIRVNHMPPQFTKHEWYTEVDETDGIALPDAPILTITVKYKGEINKLHYKVIESSGFGADKFTMVRNNDGTGSLKVVQPLDYEDKLQSYGFRFMIQVNDKGEDNDKDKNHIAYCWVIVKLRDINDNKPLFDKANIETSVYENAEIGKSLETFRATDPDRGGKSKVSYAIDRASDRRRQFAINQNGIVTIQRHLDREITTRHQVKILAIDGGVPPKTATATLTVIVQDINDNAPQLLKDYRPVLPEHYPPRKILEIFATDDDDRSKGHGPPFHFRMDPKANEDIKDSFKIENVPKGANGDGTAIVSSMRSFDREQQKEFHLPIVIKDSGNPAMSGTSTLTVIIGDVNDNKMQAGSKEIFVYNYMGQAPDTEVGSVYVYDLDDWDLPDKKFYWNTEEHPNFTLLEDTGMLTMRHGTRDGTYHLRFRVYDRKHNQVDVPANVTVTVREITHETVTSSGSIRISGITDEDFIRIWDHKSQDIVKRKIDKLRDKLAQLLAIEREKVDIFSVQLRQQRPPITDIRFSALRSSIKLNAIVLQNREEIETEVGINITMVGINECLVESQVCEGSCTNTMEVSTLPYLINANKTALVGVRVYVQPECTCGSRNFTREKSCRPDSCYNLGFCVEESSGITCRCPIGYDGPLCEKTTMSFNGSECKLYQALERCESSHLSFEFLAKKPDGTLLYNGPMAPPKPEETHLSDFIAIELESGNPRLLIDFGSGTLELKIRLNNTTHRLDDDNWHRIDVFWNSVDVRMVLENCSTSEPGSSTASNLNSSVCEVKGVIPPFNEYLDVSSPLQIGGLSHPPLDPSHFRWGHLPHGKGFDGSIRNLIFNKKIFDLADE